MLAANWSRCTSTSVSGPGGGVACRRAGTDHAEPPKTAKDGGSGRSSDARETSCPKARSSESHGIHARLADQGGGLGQIHAEPVAVLRDRSEAPREQGSDLVEAGHDSVGVPKWGACRTEGEEHSGEQEGQAGGGGDGREPEATQDHGNRGLGRLRSRSLNSASDPGWEFVPVVVSGVRGVGPSQAGIEVGRLHGRFPGPRFEPWSRRFNRDRAINTRQETVASEHPSMRAASAWLRPS